MAADTFRNGVAGAAGAVIPKGQNIVAVAENFVVAPQRRLAPIPAVIRPQAQKRNSKLLGRLPCQSVNSPGTAADNLRTVGRNPWDELPGSDAADISGAYNSPRIADLLNCSIVNLNSLLIIPGNVSKIKKKANTCFECVGKKSGDLVEDPRAQAPRRQL